MVDAHLFVVETDEADADDVCVCRWCGYMYRYEASVCSVRTEAATDDAKRSCAEAADTRDGVMATWCIMVLDRLLCSCRLLDYRGPQGTENCVFPYEMVMIYRYLVRLGELIVW